MSLKIRAMEDVPDLTARIARAAFPKGNIYLQLRDKLGTIYEDQQFIDLYAQDGQPAVNPWRLALVTVLQFAEGMPDRQAAEAVRGRIDWKYLLGLEMTDAGFDYSVLCEFRPCFVLTYCCIIYFINIYTTGNSSLDNTAERLQTGYSKKFKYLICIEKVG